MTSLNEGVLSCMQVASPSAPAAVEASAKAVTEGLAKLDGGKSPSDDTKSVEQKVEEVAQAISRQVKPFPTQACATLLLPLAEKIDQGHTIPCLSILQPSLTCSELWRPKSSGKFYVCRGLGILRSTWRCSATC